MMLSIALALAKWLIKYLIEKNWGIGKQLQEARDRVIEHDKALGDMLDEEVTLIKEINEAKKEKEKLEHELNAVYIDIEVKKLEHEKAIKEQADRIGSLTDDDVLRHEL